MLLEASVVIRGEQPADSAQVYAVHREGFPTSAEADLVDALRAAGKLLVSLVACDDGAVVVGHVAFSPVTLEMQGAPLGAGLAPVAVRPAHQHRGAGSQLIRAGLETCREQGLEYVVVLGEPAYYQRFGFRPASEWQLDSEYDAGDAFMALELKLGCLAGKSGLVRYGEEFRVFS